MIFHAADIIQYFQVALLLVVGFLHSLLKQFNLHTLL